MYYGKYADDFIFIESQEELMQMIDQDAIVIQVTGNDKKNIVNKVYEDDILSELNTNGNVYTLIRTVKEDNSQLVYTSPDDIPINSYSDEDVDPDMF
jgi:transcriptional regulatory protein LevR